MKKRFLLLFPLILFLIFCLVCFICPATSQSQPPILYLYDLSAHHVNHYEYCVPLSSPTVFCERFGPPPEGKTFPDLLRDYDIAIFVSTLQGVVNKKGPRLYINHDHERGGAPGVDMMWLGIFRERGKPYGWLADYELRSISGLGELIDIFRNDLQGVVLWDSAVPATLNVATTIAGVENLAVLRAGSPIEREVLARLPVRVSLVGKFMPGAETIPDSATPSTGSPKNDAYLWAKEQYLDTGRADPTLLAYFEDGWPAVLYSRGQMTRRGVYAVERDYVVQNKGFVFDLSPWPEPPVDDPNQPPGTDLATLKAILRSARQMAGERLIRIWGYIPWYQKYSNQPDAGGTHSDAEGEWESTWLFSSYGAYLEGGAGDLLGLGLANASVHRFAPRPERMVQRPPPTPEELIAKGYLSAEGKVAPKTYLVFYAGDYDLAHSLYVIPNGLYPYPWRNVMRGQIPMAWGFNPGLVDALPDIMSYFMHTRSEKDYFVGPNSGAGYVNPGALPPGFDSAWLQHSLRYYRPWHYRVQGWVLNGKGGPLPDEKKALFTRLAGDGVVFDRGSLDGRWPRLFQGVPLTVHWSIGAGATANEETAAADIHRAYFEYIARNGAGGPVFLFFRSTWHGPDFLSKALELARADDAAGRVAGPDGAVYHPDYQIVDPYTFFYLLRLHLGGHNSYRATFLADNIPTEMAAGGKYEMQITLRNDGWDTWQPPAYRLGVRMGPGETSPGRLSPGDYPVQIPLPGQIPPGGEVSLTFRLAAPGEPGIYTLQCDILVEAEGATHLGSASHLGEPSSFSFEEQNGAPWGKAVVVR